MIEMIFYGRGGQGAVTASEIVAKAAFREGKYAQAFPFFKAERKGAPVTAYARINDTPVEVRTSIDRADIIVVLDAAMLKIPPVLGSLKQEGLALVNMARVPEELRKTAEERRVRLVAVDATAISDSVYGPSSIPKVNLAMVGFLAGLTDVVRVDCIMPTIDEYFSGENAARAKESVRVACRMSSGTLTTHPHPFPPPSEGEG